MSNFRTAAGHRLFDPGLTQRTPIIAHVADSPLAARAAALPPSVDFSAQVTIGNQATTGDCTAWGITGAYETARRIGGYVAASLIFAKKWLYGMEDIKEGRPGADEGAQPQDGLAIGQTYGFLPESDYPETSPIPTAPTQAQLQAASKYRLQSWAPVARVASTDPYTALVPVLELLAQKKPIVIAVLVHDSFESAQGGVIPMPGPANQDPLAGGHCMFLCGYGIDASYAGGGYGLVANSWGTEWGANGFCKIPFAYLYDGPLTLGLWEITLPAAPAPVPPKPTPPATLPIYVAGSERPYAASLIANGNYAAPVVLLARDLGWSASRNGKGVYITKPKTSLLARLFGGR